MFNFEIIAIDNSVGIHYTSHLKVTKMGAYPIAKLGSYDLPECFSYIPAVPKKRMSTTPTANGVVMQCAFPTQLIYADSIIVWNIEVLFPPEFDELYDLYNTSGMTVYDFDGYWNDHFTVLFSDFHCERSPKNRLFAVRGEFQIIDIRVYDPYVALACAP